MEGEDKIFSKLKVGVILCFSNENTEKLFLVSLPNERRYISKSGGIKATL